jgi:hypothetical protein
VVCVVRVWCVWCVCVVCVWCVVCVVGHTQDIQPPFPDEDPSITAMRAKVLLWSRLHNTEEG